MDPTPVTPTPDAPLSVSPTGTPVFGFLSDPKVAFGIYLVGSIAGVIMGAGTLAPKLHLSDTLTGVACLVFAVVTPLGALSQGARK